MTVQTVGLRVEDLERLRARDWTVELVDGELFVSPTVTPYLREVIDHLASAVRDVLAPAARNASVVIEQPVTFGPRTRLVPDIAVFGDGDGSRADGALPDLVVEVRTESTERYALGPKRMVYSRARIPEYWFVEPRRELIHVLRLDTSLPDYPWPPRTVGADGTLEPAGFPGASARAGGLIYRRGT